MSIKLDASDTLGASTHRRHAGDRRPLQSGRAWTDEEIQDLREMTDAGVPVHVIARALERQESAIEAFAKKNRITLRVRVPRRNRPPQQPLVSEWSLDDTEKLRTMAERGLSVAVIACELRRSVSGIERYAIANGIALTKTNRI